MTILLLVAVIFLAYSNGANDNFKGVASIYGSKTASYKSALAWATVTTLLGSFCSYFLATGLLEKFSGKGLVPDSLASSENFLFAVAFGAGSTIIIAALLGFPISTTHSLTGAIVGVGLVAVGGEVNFVALQKGFLLPLLIAPFLGIIIGTLIYGIAHFIRVKSKINKETCICIGNEFVPITVGGNTLAFQLDQTNTTFTVGETETCIQRYDGNFLGISLQKIVDFGHFISAGVVCFSHGLNDMPKIAALVVVANVIDLKYSWVFLAFAMAIGGILNSRKVAEKMSNEITTMNSGQAFSANLATGLVSISASSFGLPVSFTHISVGALFGIGLVTKQANLKVVSTIFLSWLITLPCAAAIASLTFWLIS
jgi:inorganic phosphate transporter, PiT family